jgi:branched-chain amino acid transport system permease protein
MEFIAGTVVMIGIFVILASSYNLIIGYGGLNTVAHPIFFALGAYTAALLSNDAAIPAVGGVIAGVVVAVIAAVVLAVTTLRISGDYLLIASLGFQLGLLQLVNNFEFTGGPSGISDIPVTLAGPNRGLSYVAITVVSAAFVVWAIWRTMHSPFGRVVRAMRDDELACAALGRGLIAIKIMIFSLGCGAAGLAGGIYAYYFQYISPEQFQVAQSAQILTMVVLGGIGTTLGPIVGALVLVALPQAINFLHLPSSLVGPVQGIIFTSLVILFLFLRPEGLVGKAGSGAAR